MCAVSIRVNQAQGVIAKHTNSAGGEIRMRRVYARVVHFHRNIFAGKSKIVRASQSIRCHAHRHTREIICHHAPRGRLDDLHAGQLHQRQPVRRRLHPQNRPERRAILPHDLPAKFFNLRRRRRRTIVEQAERQHLRRRQRLLVHRLAKQRRLQLIIRFIRQHRLHERICREHVRRRRREPH